MTGPAAFHPLTRSARLLVLAALLAGLAGCGLPGVVAQAISGPEKIPAVYSLLDRPTVVMVDDYHDRLPSPTLGLLLAGRLGENLQQAEVLGKVIEPQALSTLRARHEDFRRWPIDRVGRQVGAQQVLYVYIERFQLTDAQQIFRPQLAVRVKVIDVASGSRMFPAGEAEGFPVITTMFYRNMTDAGPGAHNVLANRLMENAADKIAKLFYEHRAPEPGSGPAPYK